MAKLPSKTASGTPAEEDLSHIVDVDDATSNPAGTSKKLTIQILRRAILRPGEFVALPGGGAAGATVLSAYINNIITVATSGDSTIMVPAIKGEVKVVKNSGANPVDIFPDGTDEIDGGGAGSEITINPGASLILTCNTNGFWKS